MSDDFEREIKCIDMARYYLGQALIATHMAMRDAKERGEGEWHDILNSRCDKIRRLYDRCDLLLCLSPAEKMYASKDMCQ